jgi:hypothetical protein
MAGMTLTKGSRSLNIDANSTITVNDGVGQYILPTTAPSQIGQFLTSGPSGTGQCSWTTISPGSANYTSPDNNLVINNTNQTINFSPTVNLTAAPYTNSMSASQIHMSDNLLANNTYVYPGSISLYDGDSQNSILMKGTGMQIGSTFYSLQSDLTTLGQIQFGFGTPNTFGFYQIRLYGNIYAKCMVFYFNGNAPILCQGTSGTLSSQSFVMPSAYASILANGSGVNQVIGKIPLQEWVGGNLQNVSPGCIKLYNNDGVNYQLILGDFQNAI